MCKAPIEDHQQLALKQPADTKLLICYAALKRISRFLSPPQSPRKPKWLNIISSQAVWVPSSVSSRAVDSFIWKASRQKMESDNLCQRQTEWMFKFLFFTLSEGLHVVCKREAFCVEPCVAIHTKRLLNSTPRGRLLCGVFTAPSWGTLQSIFITNLLFSAVLFKVCSYCSQL